MKLSEVAARAGVSPSTVSRILNGTAIVSDDKRSAVDQAIADLGFIPNPMARARAGGRTLSIGVVTQAIDSPYYGVALRGIEDELDRSGYSALFVSGHWNPAEEARCIDILRSRRVDGIIVLTGRLSDAALRGHAKALPVVVTGRNLKAPGLFALNFDNLEGARLATQHLIDLGHRRIACITGDTAHPDAVERLSGYRLALSQAGLAIDGGLIAPGQFNEESGRLAMERLLDSRQRFSAVFACNDQMAFGAALALYRRGMSVPGDLSLVGFDDLAQATYATPPLTSVHQPGYELGRLTAAAMLQMLAGQNPTAAMPAPQLVVRDSSRRWRQKSAPSQR
ncbi:MAG: LacI family DNA-binding transcriptional regulator [Aquabacterium sp.]